MPSLLFLPIPKLLSPPEIKQLLPSRGRRTTPHRQNPSPDPIEERCFLAMAGTASQASLLLQKQLKGTDPDGLLLTLTFNRPDSPRSAPDLSRLVCCLVQILRRILWTGSLPGWWTIATSSSGRSPSSDRPTPYSEFECCLCPLIHCSIALADIDCMLDGCA